LHLALGDLALPLARLSSFILHPSSFTLGRLWGRIGVALGSHWGGFKVALGWLWDAYRLAINTLWGGFDVALMWLWGGFGFPSRHFILPSAFAPV
jgi:hypothetical protein